MMRFPAGPFSTIVADPPWPYKDAGKKSSTLTKTLKVDGDIARGVAISDYTTMSIEQIAKLPVRFKADRNAHLYLWTTNSFMAEAHQICEAWGFKPKTIITWVKTKKDDPTTPSMKTGYYFRGATEHCIFAVRGSAPLLTDRAIPTAFFHPRLPHSVKPDSFMEMVEECSDAYYLEMFARRTRPGWQSWGNQL